MKSKIIQQQKIQAESEHRVTFTTFNLNDSKHFELTLGCFENFEPEFKTGIKVIFRHINSITKKYTYFMTIIFPDSFIKHQDIVISKIFTSLINKKIRLYESIFEYPYFDFEDQCFPAQVFKFKKN